MRSPALSLVGDDHPDRRPPHFAPDDHNCPPRDPRDFCHGLLGAWTPIHDRDLLDHFVMDVRISPFDVCRSPGAESVELNPAAILPHPDSDLAIGSSV